MVEKDAGSIFQRAFNGRRRCRIVRERSEAAPRRSLKGKSRISERCSLIPYWIAFCVSTKRSTV